MGPAKDAEFVRRASFALLAALALHESRRADAAFLDGAAHRGGGGQSAQFVKEGRELGAAQPAAATRGLQRRGAAAGAAAGGVDVGAARWVGKDAVRDSVASADCGPVAKKSAAAATRPVRGRPSRRRTIQS